jgi:hypothetical protein
MIIKSSLLLVTNIGCLPYMSFSKTFMSKESSLPSALLFAFLSFLVGISFIEV